MSLGPTPEKGPAGIQERLRGTVPWSRLGNPDPTGGSGVGGRGAYDVSEVSCLDSLGLLYPRLVGFTRERMLLPGDELHTCTELAPLRNRAKRKR